MDAAEILKAIWIGTVGGVVGAIIHMILSKMVTKLWIRAKRLSR